MVCGGTVGELHNANGRSHDRKKSEQTVSVSPGEQGGGNPDLRIVCDLSAFQTR